MTSHTDSENGEGASPPSAELSISNMDGETTEATPGIDDETLPESAAAIPSSARVVGDGNLVDVALLVDSPEKLHEVLEAFLNKLHLTNEVVAEKYPDVSLRVAFISYRHFDEPVVADLEQWGNDTFNELVNVVQRQGSAEQLGQDVLRGLAEVPSVGWSAKHRLLVHIADGASALISKDGQDGEADGGTLQRLRDECGLQAYYFAYFNEDTQALASELEAAVGDEPGWLTTERLFDPDVLPLKMADLAISLLDKAAPAAHEDTAGHEDATGKPELEGAGSEGALGVEVSEPPEEPDEPPAQRSRTPSQVSQVTSNIKVVTLPNAEGEAAQTPHRYRGSSDGEGSPALKAERSNTSSHKSSTRSHKSSRAGAGSSGGAGPGAGSVRASGAGDVGTATPKGGGTARPSEAGSVRSHHRSGAPSEAGTGAGAGMVSSVKSSPWSERGAGDEGLVKTSRLSNPGTGPVIGSGSHRGSVPPSEAGAAKRASGTSGSVKGSARPSELGAGAGSVKGDARGSARPSEVGASGTAPGTPRACSPVPEDVEGTGKSASPSEAGPGSVRGDSPSFVRVGSPSGSDGASWKGSAKSAPAGSQHSRPPAEHVDVSAPADEPRKSISTPPSESGGGKSAVAPGSAPDGVNSPRSVDTPSPEPPPPAEISSSVAPQLLPGMPSIYTEFSGVPISQQVSTTAAGAEVSSLSVGMQPLPWSKRALEDFKSEMKKTAFELPDPRDDPRTARLDTVFSNPRDLWPVLPPGALYCLEASDPRSTFTYLQHRDFPDTKVRVSTYFGKWGRHLVDYVVAWQPTPRAEAAWQLGDAKQPPLPWEPRQVVAHTTNGEYQYANTRMKFRGPKSTKPDAEVVDFSDAHGVDLLDTKAAHESAPRNSEKDRNAHLIDPPRPNTWGELARRPLISNLRARGGGVYLHHVNYDNSGLRTLCGRRVPAGYYFTLIPNVPAKIPAVPGGSNARVRPSSAGRAIAAARQTRSMCLSPVASGTAASLLRRVRPGSKSITGPLPTVLTEGSIAYADDDRQGPTETLSVSVVPEYEQYGVAEEEVRAVISLKAIPEVPKRPPVALTCVLDRSGSMGGESIRLVQATCHFLIDQLTAADYLGLISYSDDVTEDLPLMQMTEAGRARAHSVVDALCTDGGTALYEGLLAGVQQQMKAEAKLRSSRDSGKKGKEGGNAPEVVHSCFLFTDGQANEGPSSLEEIISSLEALQAPSGRHVTVHTFGFGSDHSVDVLQKLAESHSGMYYYISRPNDIASGFGDALGGLLNVVATSVRVEVRPRPGVTLTALRSGGRAIASAASAAVPGGAIFNDVFAEETRECLLVAKVADGLTDSELAEVDLQYTDVATGQRVVRSAVLRVHRSPEQRPAGASSAELVAVTAARLETLDAIEAAQRAASQHSEAYAHALLDELLASLTGSQLPLPAVSALVDLTRETRTLIKQMDLGSIAGIVQALKQQRTATSTVVCAQYIAQYDHKAKALARQAARAAVTISPRSVGRSGSLSGEVTGLLAPSLSASVVVLDKLGTLTANKGRWRTYDVPFNHPLNATRAAELGAEEARISGRNVRAFSDAAAVMKVAEQELRMPRAFIPGPLVVPEWNDIPRLYVEHMTAARALMPVTELDTYGTSKLYQLIYHLQCAATLEYDRLDAKLLLLPQMARLGKKSAEVDAWLQAIVEHASFLYDKLEIYNTALWGTAAAVKPEPSLPAVQSTTITATTTFTNSTAAAGLPLRASLAVLPPPPPSATAPGETEGWMFPDPLKGTAHASRSAVNLSVQVKPSVREQPVPAHVITQAEWSTITGIMDPSRHKALIDAWTRLRPLMTGAVLRGSGGASFSGPGSLADCGSSDAGATATGFGDAKQASGALTAGAATYDPYYHGVVNREVLDYVHKDLAVMSAPDYVPPPPPPAALPKHRGYRGEGPLPPELTAGMPTVQRPVRCRGIDETPLPSTYNSIDIWNMRTKAEIVPPRVRDPDPRDAGAVRTSQVAVQRLQAARQFAASQQAAIRKSMLLAKGLAPPDESDTPYYGSDVAEDEFSTDITNEGVQAGTPRRRLRASTRASSIVDRGGTHFRPGTACQTGSDLGMPTPVDEAEELEKLAKEEAAEEARRRLLRGKDGKTRQEILDEALQAADAAIRSLQPRPIGSGVMTPPLYEPDSARLLLVPEEPRDAELALEMRPPKLKHSHSEVMPFDWYKHTADSRKRVTESSEQQQNERQLQRNMSIASVYNPGGNGPEPFSLEKIWMNPNGSDIESGMDAIALNDLPSSTSGRLYAEPSGFGGLVDYETAMSRKRAIAGAEVVHLQTNFIPKSDVFNLLVVYCNLGQQPDQVKLLQQAIEAPVSLHTVSATQRAATAVATAAGAASALAAGTVSRRSMGPRNADMEAEAMRQRIHATAWLLGVTWRRISNETYISFLSRVLGWPPEIASSMHRTRATHIIARALVRGHDLSTVPKAPPKL